MTHGLTSTEALNRIKEKYGDLLDFPYFENEYKGVSTSILTTECPIHGKIEVPYTTLMYKHSVGCKKCLRFKLSLGWRFGKDGAKKEMAAFYRFVKTQKTWCRNSQIRGMVELADNVGFKFWYEKFKTSADYVSRKEESGHDGKHRDNRSTKRLVKCPDSSTAMKLISTVHGDSFDFPKIHDEYKKPYTKITAVCMIHGAFLTTVGRIVSDHRGCPECGSIKAYVYES